TNAAISGFVLDPERKKMSKSKGNVVVPTEVFERHSADAVRYWAGRARLGIDAAFDEKQMKDGRRLAIKVLNASRFTLGIEAEAGSITDPLDLAMLASLRGSVDAAAEALTAVRRTKALAKLSLRARVRRVVVRDTPERLAKLALAEADLCEAGNIEKIELVESDDASIEVELDTDEP